MTEGNALFKFIEGLKPAIRKDVLLAQPTTITDAEMAAERSEVANFYVSSKACHLTRFVPRQQPRQHDSSGIVPMELGVVST